MEKKQATAGGQESVSSNVPQPVGNTSPSAQKRKSSDTIEGHSNIAKRAKTGAQPGASASAEESEPESAEPSDEEG